MMGAKGSKILLEITQRENSFDYNCGIVDALSQAETEIQNIDESIDSIKKLLPQCDKVDYALSASSGVLCGLIDIFLVGKPKDSILCNITNKWAQHCVKNFAKKCGWKGDDNNPLSSAINYLERHYKIPYDQTSLGQAAKEVFDLDSSVNTYNHHFASLGHNPSLLGLFFSILDQFTNSSHFVLDGQLIELVEADDKFQLRGHSFRSKVWCGMVNWFCHIMSDASGSSSSAARGSLGMGIPSPLWTWINSVIAIKAKLNIPVFEFEKNIQEFAMELFNKGFDARFQSAQVIPVVINELTVRLFYAIRRGMRYYSETPTDYRTFKGLWKYCNPFNNPTIGRMLTVAHGTFCLIDVGDAAIRGWVYGGGVSFDCAEFFLRLNIAGVGRFTLSLYGETKRSIRYHRVKNEAELAAKEKKIVENYIEGLKQLKEVYNDAEYLTFIDDLANNEYLTAFNKTSLLAHHSGVPSDDILSTKEDIDNYFKSK